MQSLNYLIIGEKNEASKKALSIAQDFFKNKKIMTQEILQIHPIEGKISVDQIDNLVSKMSSTSLFSDQSGYIIFQAEQMSAISQNKLLKTLEEADPSKIQILTSSNPSAIIGTLKSRLIQIEIPPPSHDIKIKYLHKNQVPPKYHQLLISLYADIESGFKAYQEDEILFTNILKFSELLSSSKVKAFLFYESNLEKIEQELLLNMFDYIFTQKNDIPKLILLSNLKSNLSKGANPKMQIERIFWEYDE